MTATSHLPRISSVPPARRRTLAVIATAVVVLALAFALGSRALQRSTSTAGAAQGSAAGSSSVAGTAESARDGAGVGLGAPSVSPQSGSDTAKAPADATATGAGSLAGVVTAKIARSAWLGIKVTDLTGAAGRARVIATGAGGQVTSENVVTSVDPTGSQRSLDQRSEAGPSVPEVGVDEARMVLSVPAKALDQVLTELSKIGSVSYRSSQSQDVTDTYVDTKARIQPMQDGITRVRALLAKTTDLQQVITLESELTRRQAELDSLTQRLAQLDAMTTNSDVTVTLWTDATAPVASDDGIAGGLRTAWDSLLGSVTVILTGLAALLPWLVVLLPIALLVLRHRRRRATVAPTTPAATATSAATAAPATPPANGPEPEPVGAPAKAGGDPEE